MVGFTYIVLFLVSILLKTSGSPIIKASGVQWSEPTGTGKGNITIVMMPQNNSCTNDSDVVVAVKSDYQILSQDTQLLNLVVNEKQENKSCTTPRTNVCCDSKPSNLTTDNNENEEFVQSDKNNLAKYFEPERKIPVKPVSGEASSGIVNLKHEVQKPSNDKLNDELNNIYKMLNAPNQLKPSPENLKLPNNPELKNEPMNKPTINSISPNISLDKSKEKSEEVKNSVNDKKQIKPYPLVPKLTDVAIFEKDFKDVDENGNYLPHLELIGNPQAGNPAESTCSQSNQNLSTAPTEIPKLSLSVTNSLQKGQGEVLTQLTSSLDKAVTTELCSDTTTPSCDNTVFDKISQMVAVTNKIAQGVGNQATDCVSEVTTTTECSSTKEYSLLTDGSSPLGGRGADTSKITLEPPVSCAQTASPKPTEANCTEEVASFPLFASTMSPMRAIGTEPAKITMEASSSCGLPSTVLSANTISDDCAAKTKSFEWPFPQDQRSGSPLAGKAEEPKKITMAPPADCGKVADKIETSASNGDHQGNNQQVDGKLALPLVQSSVFLANNNDLPKAKDISMTINSSLDEYPLTDSQGKVEKSNEKIAELYHSSAGISNSDQDLQPDQSPLSIMILKNNSNLIRLKDARNPEANTKQKVFKMSLAGKNIVLEHARRPGKPNAELNDLKSKNAKTKYVNFQRYLDPLKDKDDVSPDIPAVSSEQVSASTNDIDRPSSQCNVEQELVTMFDNSTGSPEMSEEPSTTGSDVDNVEVVSSTTESQTINNDSINVDTTTASGQAVDNSNEARYCQSKKYSNKDRFVYPEDSVKEIVIQIVKNKKSPSAKRKESKCKTNPNTENSGYLYGKPMLNSQDANVIEQPKYQAKDDRLLVTQEEADHPFPGEMLENENLNQVNDKYSKLEDSKESEQYNSEKQAMDQNYYLKKLAKHLDQYQIPFDTVERNIIV